MAFLSTLDPYNSRYFYFTFDLDKRLHNYWILVVTYEFNSGAFYINSPSFLGGPCVSVTKDDAVDIYNLPYDDSTG